VVRAPFNDGNGYYGVLLGSLDSAGQVAALILVDRLFRLPIINNDPLGVLTDVMTNAAMWTSWWSRSVIDANHAAAESAAAASDLGVPLIMVGQFQAGGVAQLQAAYVAATLPQRSILTGFITFNAASVAPSVRRLGQRPAELGGINFLKDLDPLFGPHRLLPNHAGLAVYIHPDDSGSGTPGHQSFLAAWLHPAQHTLSAFDNVSLSKALASTLTSKTDQCAEGSVAS
jgi:hypothetical protein